MRSAVRVEMLKLRRSPVTLIASALMVVLVPALALGFVWIAENGTGATAEKARAMIVGEGWEAYLSSVDQIAAAAVFVGAGVVVSWAFGREHADRTFPSLFALPVSRGSTAAAKLSVLAAWAVVVSVALTLVALLLGTLTNIAPFDAEAAVGMLRVFAVVLSTSLLATTVAFFASVGRGYLPGIGAVVLIVAAAQFSVLFGAGGWFPYAVPGLVAVAGTDGAPQLNAGQVALVPILVLVAAALTIRWWRRAEAL